MLMKRKKKSRIGYFGDVCTRSESHLTMGKEFWVIKSGAPETKRYKRGTKTRREAF